MLSSLLHQFVLATGLALELQGQRIPLGIERSSILNQDRLRDRYQVIAIVRP
jgi:hypothetical protein